MTDDRTLDRAARSWLEEGPTQAPDRAVDAALSRIQTTRQERELRLPWRFPTMNPIPRIAAVAAVLAVAIGAAYLLFRSVSTVGPQATHLATTPPSSPSPAPTATPLATPRALTMADLGTTPVAGTYHVSDFAAPYTVSLPSGWVLQEYETNNIVMRSDSSFLTLVVMDAVYTDPCYRTGSKAIDGSVDGLLAGFASMKDFTVADAQDLSIPGAEGKVFTLSNTVDIAADGCSDPDVLAIGTFDRNGSPEDVLYGAGESDSLWAVSSNGVAILIGGPADILSTLVFDDPVSAGLGEEPSAGPGPIPNGIYELDVPATEVERVMASPVFNAADRNVITQSLGIGATSTLTVRLVIADDSITIQHAADHAQFATAGTWPTPPIDDQTLGIKYNPTVLGHIFEYAIQWNSGRTTFRLDGGGASTEIGPVAQVMFLLLNSGEFARVG